MPHKSVQTPRRHTDRQCTGISTHFPRPIAQPAEIRINPSREEKTFSSHFYLPSPFLFLYAHTDKSQTGTKRRLRKSRYQPEFRNATKWYFTIFCFKRQVFRCFFIPQTSLLPPGSAPTELLLGGKRRSLPLLPRMFQRRLRVFAEL